jgi:hypothetical protein
MMTLLDLCAVALATGAIIEVWHKGSLFALARAHVQAKNDSAKYGSFRSLWTELLLCPFCKSYHIPVYLYATILAGNWFGGIVSVVPRMLVYSLAATRLSNLIDGLLPARMRYEQPADLLSGINSGENRD